MHSLSHRQARFTRKALTRTVRCNRKVAPPAPSSLLAHTTAPFRARNCGGRLLRPPAIPLLLINEMATAVLLPASFIGFCAEGVFLAVTDGFDPACAHAAGCQCSSRRTGAPDAQSQFLVRGTSGYAGDVSRNVEI